MIQKLHSSHIFVISGPPNSSKSTLAKTLAANYKYPFIDGGRDEVYNISLNPHTITKTHSIEQFHTTGNTGDEAPLTDADCWEWLIQLREKAANLLGEGAPGVFIACSALEEKYRDVIRIISLTRRVAVHFIYMRLDARLLTERLESGANHFTENSVTKRELEILENSKGRKNHNHLLISVGDNLADCDTARRIIGEILIQNR